MKTRNAAIILDDTITTIVVRYAGNKTDYIFLCKKELASTLEKDDWVVTRASNGNLGCCQVIEVHAESEVDLDSTLSFAWAFQKIDMPTIKALEAALDDAEKSIRGMQRKALRDQVRTQIEGNAMKALTDTKEAE